MIKTIIFDLGNVLLNFKPIEYLRSKLSDEIKVQEVYKEIFLSEEWILLDKGDITEEEAVNRICNRSFNNKELIKLCMENWYELLTPIEESVKILEEVKLKGYKTLALSNFHLLAYKNVIERYDFFNYFDGGIISFKEKLLKPENEIYEKLIMTYEINPKETIFIDDTKSNIESAKKLGFKTILFDNSVNLRNELIEYKVLNDY
ncbi:HAD family phosphatase [uncultured Clostridium sp.]|uniref:HAD family hydrolase n=1 Tax=uncultured Clostridium sp. TaxID=59620 RepID=UPI0028E8AD5E|nr:HAD family phosphatase [uncultured Clostridium sp.]